ncbi:hypothetical protein AB0Y39_10015 [Weissella paramesenteroides]|uniref:hypothetical protein n=1 Tax=Weissella paramesenteroides TaxID=1249 RepID=UPI003F1EF57B
MDVTRIVPQIELDIVYLAVSLLDMQNVQRIDFSGLDNVRLDIDEMEPTMVPSFLLSEQTVNCFMLAGTINQKEELLIVVYYDLADNYIGKAALYYGDVAFEKKVGENTWQ